MNVRYVILFACLFILPAVTLSQNTPQPTLPEVGKPMPDFTLTDVHFFSKRQVSLSDFKGKWLFLDFWFKNCTVCIASFPKVNAFQNKFKDHINYFLVGLNERTNRGIEDLYSKLANKYSLELPVAFDSVLVPQWNITSMPYILVIDPNGILRAITNGADLTDTKIKELIDNKNPSLYDLTVDRTIFDADLFKQANYDSSILVKSTLARYKNEVGTYAPIDAHINTKLKVKGYRISGTTLNHLYLISELGFSPLYIRAANPLYGKYNPEVILEIKDSTDFKYEDRLKDYPAGWYSYSMVIYPTLANKEFMMSVLRDDLKRYFGYDATLEMRKVGVWKLVAKPGAKELLRTKFNHLSKTYKSDTLPGSGYLGFEMRKGKLESVLHRIISYSTYILPSRLFYDETGITEDIDIVIEANMSNIVEVRRELNKYKLDLILEDKLLPTVVIRDGSRMMARKMK